MPSSTCPVPEPPAIEKTPRLYQAGSLHYTLRGLFVLFAWLLWGDFAFTFFESIFGRFMPLYLKEMEASNTLIGIMTGSIAGAVNLFLLPGISQWSDTCRTRWGRRVPFLAVTTPLTVAALILVGFAPEIGTWLHRHVTLYLAPAQSEKSVILAFLCLCVVAFHCLNMVLCNGFIWLVREVVPQEVMGRFLSWFKIVSTTSSIVFSWYVFPYVITRRQEVCVGVGLFYLTVFLLMCWRVKEGEYPASVGKERPGVLKSFALYFHDCFSVPLYRNYFYAIILGCLGNCASPFFLLFFRTNLGLDMADLGKIFALGAAVTAATYLPMGWLCERFTPIRVAITSQAAMLLVTLLSFFLIKDKASLIFFTVAGSIAVVGWLLGSATLTMKLFPSEEFGKLSSGINIFGTGIAILGNYLIGLFMDLVHSNYRMAYLWAMIGGLAIIPMLLVYREWKHHGGPDNYVPPPAGARTTPDPGHADGAGLKREIM